MKRTWNYRLLAYPDGEDTYFHVAEVHYKDETPFLHSPTSATVGGNTLLEIENVLVRMNKCLTKPILWGNYRFPEEYKKEEEDHE